MTMGQCPFKQTNEVQFCPLYLAAHYPGYGCDGGRLGESLCAVDTNDIDYADELGRFKAAYPREVALLEWERSKRELKAQRDRNMRLNGVH
ncbi:hypothetical protein MXMO3_01764 [Maritalea myrionectae]|uniref:Uncharacterized protein n=1 Tax=Maritalea myrionectae TaxID=454601 RepID=A0A2R4MEK5_9HYPH|nr:hypothetical protein [Maritalea myrionectae]AVX04289.1 hypothetical protein MXMO3_01764 [Maritalea myrionectae]